MARISAEQGVGVCRTEFGKNLGEGLCEFRLREETEFAGSPVRLLLRVFFLWGQAVLHRVGVVPRFSHRAYTQELLMRAAVRMRQAFPIAQRPCDITASGMRHFRQEHLVPRNNLVQRERHA
jgi:hypothetical protein